MKSYVHFPLLVLYLRSLERLFPIDRSGEDRALAGCRVVNRYPGHSGTLDAWQFGKEITIKIKILACLRTGSGRPVGQGFQGVKSRINAGLVAAFARTRVSRPPRSCERGYQSR